MALLSASITPTNLVTTSGAATLTNKTLTGAVMNGTLGATTPSTVVATTVKASTTMGVGAATPSASGAGITFPADQTILGASSDANTLDDYEEGTWTPVLTGDAGGTASTYAQQLGKYTKIGNVVTADVSIILSAKGTITGSAIVTGLPFTGNASYNSPVTWGYWDSLATNWASVGGWLNNGTTIYLGGRKTSGALIEVFANGDLNNTSRFNCQIIYTLS